MRHCARSSSSAIKLLLSPTPAPSSSAGSGSGDSKLVCFHIGEGWEEKGVEVGAIGRALAMDPASVRLNGHLLGTSGPDHVAASVTWRSLLAFFLARGLPTGRGGGQVAGSPAADGPIIVQGRPASPGSLSGDPNPSGLWYHYYDRVNGCHEAGGKRRMPCREESSLEEEKTSHCSSPVAEEDSEGGVTDSALCMNKKLRLDDDDPLPQRRKLEAHSGPRCGEVSLAACTRTTGFALNCVMGHRKRSREDELVAPLPSKRAA